MGSNLPEWCLDEIEKFDHISRDGDGRRELWNGFPTSPHARQSNIGFRVVCLPLS